MAVMTATLRGVTVGYGTDYEWADYPQGLFGGAEVRATEQVRAFRDGLDLQDELYGGRTVVFDLLICAESDLELELAILAITNAWQVSRYEDVELTVTVAGAVDPYSLIGRPRGAEVVPVRFRPQSPDRPGSRGARVRCVFRCSQPFLYGIERLVQLQLPTALGGLTFPATAPFVFGGGTGGLTIVDNLGTAPVPFRVEFAGPMTDFWIEHADLGLELRFVGTLAAGETLVVDTNERSVILQPGNVSRYAWLQAGASTWFDLQPGDNPIEFHTASGTGTATLYFRPGYV